MFTLHTASYNLRNNYILTLPVSITTTYGFRSFSYHAGTMELTTGLCLNFEP